LGRYPQVSTFIRKNSKEFSGLKVQYVSQADPVLKMKGASNNEDIVSLKAWTGDQISAYLKQNLKT